MISAGKVAQSTQLAEAIPHIYLIFSVLNYFESVYLGFFPNPEMTVSFFSSTTDHITVQILLTRCIGIF